MEALGLKLAEEHNMRVGVLCVDPSSSLTGGSVLGGAIVGIVLHVRCIIVHAIFVPQGIGLEWPNCLFAMTALCAGPRPAAMRVIKADFE